MQSSFPAPLSTHLKKISTAETVNMTVSSRVIGDSATELKVRFAKPNFLKLEGPEGFTLSDGKDLYVYNKKTNSYSSSPLGEGGLTEVLSNPGLVGWSAFFSKNPGSEYGSVKVGGKKAIQGKAATIVDVAMKRGGVTLSLFIDSASSVVGGYTYKVLEKEYLVLASDLKIGMDKAQASDFAFSAPEGAKKAEELKTTASFASVQKILMSQCMPCHNAQNRRSDVDLTNHHGIVATVTPGNSATSQLIKSMRASGGQRMPKNRSAVPEDQIKLIEQWINDGAKSD